MVSRSNHKLMVSGDTPQPGLPKGSASVCPAEDSPASGVYNCAKVKGEIMQLSVRFFALYRERAGCGLAPVVAPDGATVADLVGIVRQRFPTLAPPEVQIVVAVNEEYADPDTVLREGDEICLIPPVSGG